MTNAGYSTVAVHDRRPGLPVAAPDELAASATASRGYTRQNTGGCGFWNNDAELGQQHRAADDQQRGQERAPAQTGLSNVKIMELQTTFNGRRLCENTVGLLEEKGLATWQSAGAVDNSEWIEQIRTVSTVFGPYYVQESLHPNYWGEKALRNCVRQAYNGGTPRGGTCTRTANGLNAQRRAEHDAAVATHRCSRGRHPGAWRPRDRSGSAFRHAPRHEPLRQDHVHLRRQPRHRPGDRAARRARRRQRRADRQDRRAAPQARGHGLHRGRGDRGGRRPGAADRRRHPRRATQVAGGGRADRRALRRHRHLRQQRLGDQPRRAPRRSTEALRPDAGHQRARHVRRQPRLHPAPAQAGRTRTSSRCRRRSARGRSGSARTSATRSPSTA